MDLSNYSDEQLQEMIAKKKQQEAQSYLNGLSDEELQRMIDEKHPSNYDVAKEAGLKVLDGAGRVLDYAGGLSRTAIAGASDTLLDTDLYKDGDFSDAIKGQAPTSDEILGRAGVDDNIARGVAGFALDALSDPLTYGTGGLSAIAKGASKLPLLARLKNVAKPTSQALSLPSRGVAKAGEIAYNWPFRSINKDAVAKAIRKGADPDLVRKPTDVMLEKGIYGKMNTVANETGELTKTLRGRNDDILNSINTIQKRGGSTKGSVTKLVRDLKEYREVLASNKSGGKLVEDGIKSIDNELARLETFRKTRKLPVKRIKGHDVGGIPITEVDYKTLKGGIEPNVDDLNELRKNFNMEFDDIYHNDKNFLSPEIRAKTKAASGVKSAQVDAMNRAIKGSGDEFARNNADIATIINGDLLPDYMREVNRQFLTGMTAGGLAAGNDTAKAFTLGALLNKAARATPVATGTGVLLNKAGKGAVSGKVIDSASRRLLIDLLKSKQEER